MNYTVDDVKNAVLLCADKAIYSKPMLTLLDNYSGDGDMGISMENGAKSLKKVSDHYNGNNIGEYFTLCACAFNKAAASTIGTLISSALQMLGNKFCNRIELNDADLLIIAESMADAIVLRGNAHLGDKTLLDALIPYSAELNASYHRNGNIYTAARDAAHAAKTAAKSTRGMLATIGRAKWIGERSREYPDPGAVLCSLLADTLAYPERDFGYKLPDYDSPRKEDEK